MAASIRTYLKSYVHGIHRREVCKHSDILEHVLGRHLVVVLELIVQVFCCPPHGAALVLARRRTRFLHGCGAGGYGDHLSASVVNRDSMVGLPCILTTRDCRFPGMQYDHME